jgi:hypothetical protein
MKISSRDTPRRGLLNSNKMAENSNPPNLFFRDNRHSDCTVEVKKEPEL